MGDRVPLTAPFTPREEHVVELVAQNLTYAEIGERLHLTSGRVANLVCDAARKIPGSLPAKVRVQLWWRGVDRATLGEDSA